jgi:hypothetical protein
MRRSAHPDESVFFPTANPKAAPKPPASTARTQPSQAASYGWSATVSLALHAILLLTLLWIPGVHEQATQAVVVDTRLDELEAHIEVTRILDAEDTGTSPAETSLSAMSPVSPSAADSPLEGLLERLPEEALPDPELPSVVKLDLPRAEQLTIPVQVEGLSGEYVGGVEGAVDRITFELLRALEKNKVLAIWLFDSTESLRDERARIARRFEKVYRELGLLGKTEGDLLLTALMAFGKSGVFLTEEPTSDVAKLQQRVESIPDDQTGEEYVFSALTSAAKKFAPYYHRGRRDLVFIVVTDEAGDDEALVDEVLSTLRELRAKVYVLGAPAIWGRRTMTVPYRSEEGQVVGYPEVTRGPESAEVEVVHLPYWFGGAPGILNSGFGTWGLTRLCRETGGIYFLVDYGDLSEPISDPLVLQPFEPDYCSRQDYMLRAQKSRLRSALLEVARTLKVRANPPALLFPAYSPEVMSQTMKQAQEEAALLKAQVDPAVSLLASVEKERDREKSRRWQAHFDLIYGRLLATKVRAYCYNAMLAEMRVKPKPFQTPNHNAWKLVPDDQIPEDTPAGTALVRAAAKARELLERCVNECEGTPWATLAAEELRYPLGFRWEEAFVPPPRQANPAPSPFPPPSSSPPNRKAPPRPVPKKI